VTSHVATLGIVTADRPHALERCVSSYIRHLQRHGRSPRIVIVDDSKREANRSATRQIARKARRSYAGVVHFIGAREKAALRGQLERVGIDPATVAFGLPVHGRAFAPGANRSHLLLATTGELMLTADDDTVCDTWSATQEEHRVAFTGHADPRRYSFFTSRRKALSGVRPVDVDLLAAHESLLGRSLAGVAAGPENTDVGEACSHVVAGLKSKDASYRIRLTSSGVAGDSGMYSPYRMMFSPTTARHWTSIDERTFKRALRNRETQRIVWQPTVTHQSATMMYSAGLDNRTLMPPFIPVGANEDGMFGVTLHLIAPLSFLGYLPVGIVHDSNRGSTYDGGPMPCVSQTRIAELLFALLHQWTASEQVQATPDGRLRSIGDYLIALSEAATADFAAYAVTTSLDLWKRERDRLDAVIAITPELPSFWLRELEKYRRTFLKRAIEPAFFVPIELKQPNAERNGFRRTQKYLGQWGRLMQAWPEIWEIARREGIYRPA
jgi:hypothetical protein